MRTKEEVLGILREVLPSLRERYPLGRVDLFGSYSRGDHEAGSDVDLAVEFTGKMSYREHFALEEELSAALGVRVDIVDRGKLRPRIGERVRKEAISL